MKLLVLLTISLPFAFGDTDSCSTENTCETNPKRDCSCFENKLKTHPSGFNTFIQPNLCQPEFEVFCSKLDGKLWTVIQNRQGSEEDKLGPDGFDRKYSEYEEGFGNLTGNFWLGLKKIHALTSSADMTLVLEMYTDKYEFRQGQYNLFMVSQASKKYRLTVSDYSGDAAMTIERDSNGRPFSAKGQDNGRKGCPKDFQGDGGTRRTGSVVPPALLTVPTTLTSLDRWLVTPGASAGESRVDFYVHHTRRLPAGIAD